MTDNDLIKTYILILNKILTKELTSIRMKGEEKELNELERSSEMWNNGFGLDDINFLFFLKSLEERKILEIYFYNTLKPSEKDDGLLESFYGEEMKKGDWLSIHYGNVNTEIATKYRDELNALFIQDKTEKGNKSDEFWVSKDNNGNYLFDGNIVSLSKDTEYVKIFDTVYSLRPKGGDVTYKEIEKICKSEKLKITNK